MPQGTLEVVLVCAGGLTNTDYFSKMDPYAVLTCETQEKKSKIASGEGTNPQWNQTFLFDISEGVNVLNIKIMDKDNFTADDFVGEASIHLGPVFDEGNVPTTMYNVVKDEKYCGGVRVSLKFTNQSSRRGGIPEQEFGGYRLSSMN